MGFPPGTSTDTLTRLIVGRMSDGLGQQIVVENRPGAGSSIAAEQVAKSAPDGYTLALGTAGPMAMSPALQQVSFDPVKDFTPIINLIDSPHALAISSKIPAKTVLEFSNLAKLPSNKWSYSSPGIGNSGHLAMELLKLQTSMPLQHIAYKGAAPALADLMAGHVDAYFTSSAALVPHLNSGNIRILAVTSNQRLSIMPQVPTMAENGMQGFDFAVWSGLLGPHGMPSDLVQKINADANRILANPEFVEQLKKNAMNVWGGTPQSFANTIANDLQKWKKIIKDGNIKAE